MRAASDRTTPSKLSSVSSLGSTFKSAASQYAERRQLAANWTAEVTGREVEAISDVTFWQALQGGEALCEALNIIRPGSVQQVQDCLNCWLLPTAILRSCMQGRCTQGLLHAQVDNTMPSLGCA